MADLFLDRVAELAGLTARRLKEHKIVLHALGLIDESSALDDLIRQHELVVFECAEHTDPGIDLNELYRKATGETPMPEPDRPIDTSYSFPPKPE